jgi:hypothetical protein
MSKTKIIVITLLLISMHKAYTQTPNHISENFTLVWNDEFNEKQLDTLKWNHRSLGRRSYGIVTKESTYLDNKGHLIQKVAQQMCITIYIGMDMGSTIKVKV